MPAHDVPALVLRALTKSFGRPAVDRLDLTVARRRVLCAARPQRRRQDDDVAHGCRAPAADAGDIRIFGVDARRSPIEAKRIIAWLPDEPMLYDKLDPLEYLEFVSGLWSVEGAARSGWRKSC